MRRPQGSWRDPVHLAVTLLILLLAFGCSESDEGERGIPHEPAAEDWVRPEESRAPQRAPEPSG